MSGGPRRSRTPTTDTAIEADARRMPPEWYRIDGAGVVSDLRARRDGLPAVAEKFYLHLSRRADVHLTGRSERIDAVGTPGGDREASVRLTSSRDGVRRLARSDRGFAVDIPAHAWWNGVGTLADLRLAEVSVTRGPATVFPRTPRRVVVNKRAGFGVAARDRPATPGISATWRR